MERMISFSDASAAISKQLLSLKDQLGSAVSVGKHSGTRETYRNVQRRLVHEGGHASEKTRRDDSQRATRASRQKL
jgi:hypothetical protein